MPRESRSYSCVRCTLAGQSAQSVGTGRQSRASVLGKTYANLHLFGTANVELCSARREARRDGVTSAVRLAYTPAAAA